VSKCIHRDWFVWGDGPKPIAEDLSYEEMKDVVKQRPKEYYGECNTCGNVHNG
jgi:hypothetical protein